MNDAPVSHRILIVAEDPGAVGDLQFQLVSAGHSCLGASSPDDALTTASAAPRPVELVIVDANLPDDGARSLVERFRSRWPRARFLVLCTRTAAGIVRQAVHDVMAVLP